MSEAPSSWYSVRSLSPGVWSITELGRVNCYLVAGSERALLIDTGFGLSNLAELVASLTPLPVTVVITHGHIDHVSGAGQFPEVLIDPADAAWVPADQVTMRRNMLPRLQESTLPADFSPEAWINASAPVLRPLAEDAVFELGGRTLKVISTPGHTPGSVCLLTDDGLLFTGDTIVEKTILLYLPQSQTLRTYISSLERLLAHRAEITTLLPGHGVDPLPPARLTDIYKGANAILSGEVTGELQQTPLGPATCARFASCTICYDPERLG